MPVNPNILAMLQNQPDLIANYLLQGYGWGNQRPNNWNPNLFNQLAPDQMTGYLTSILQGGPPAALQMQSDPNQPATQGPGEAPPPPPPAQPAPQPVANPITDPSQTAGGQTRGYQYQPQDPMSSALGNAGTYNKGLGMVQDQLGGQRDNPMMANWMNQKRAYKQASARLSPLSHSLLLENGFPQR